jgi:hypothetical protein
MSGGIRRIQLERVAPKPSAPNTNTETRYRVMFEGNEIGVWRDPECSAARFLVDYGLASRDDILRAYRGSSPCMSGLIGWFADRRVKEDGKDGTPRFVKWTPNPFAELPRMAQKPASDVPAGIGIANHAAEAPWPPQYAPAGIFQINAPQQVWTPR